MKDFHIENNNELHYGWNYRVFRNNQKYEIRDVFYDDNADVVNIGEKPCIVEESLKEIKDALNRMISSCEKPIIDYNTGEEIQER